MVENTPRYFVPIHFVSNNWNYQEFQVGLDRYRDMRDIFKSKTDKFRFGLKLTTDDQVLPNEIREGVRELIHGLESDVMFLYDPVSKGPGTSVRQVFFNPTFTGGLAINICLDQQVIASEEAIDRAIDLTDRVERDNILYATGSRNVPVILGSSKHNSDLRIIHELFNALAMGSKYLIPHEKIEGVNPAYASIGEHTTGFDILNLTHPKYPELARCMIQATQVADMNGFASCYYVPLKSSQLNGLGVSGYVCARENPFPQDVENKQEYERVTKMIKYQTEQLGRTDVRSILLNSLKEPANTARISDFYPRTDVEFVRSLMLDGLAQK